MIQLPKRDDVWRHYKGGSYLILGLAHDEDGLPVVVYCDNMEPPRPPYYTRKLGTYLQTIDHEGRKVPRFKLTGERRTAPDPEAMQWALREIAFGYLGDQTAESQFLWAQQVACKALGLMPPPSKRAALDAGVPTDAPALNGGQQ